MASTTAEVILHFGTDDPFFVETVNALRFMDDYGEMTAKEIIKILTPVWNVTYDVGYRYGNEDGYA